MTSAPKSAMMVVDTGPAMKLAASITRIPSRRRVMVGAPLVGSDAPGQRIPRLVARRAASASTKVLVALCLLPRLNGANVSRKADSCVGSAVPRGNPRCARCRLRGHRRGLRGQVNPDLLNLCTVSTEDARYKEALHFCHGYLVGAFH